MHHAGLLPIVKEVVEMLFCRGVIKVKLHYLRTILMFYVCVHMYEKTKVEKRKEKK